jgi:hypothetical protein
MSSEDKSNLTKGCFQTFWRRREITTGKFPAQGAWRRWQSVGEVFGEDEYDDQDRSARDRTTNDNEYEVREVPCPEDASSTQN